MVVNSAEVKINCLGEFELNGLNHRENIYNLNTASETLVIKDQVIIMSWLVNFDEMMLGSLDDIKSFLKEHESNAQSLCKTHGGILHKTMFSCHIISFKDSYFALSGIKDWVNRCIKYLKEKNYDNKLYIAVYKGYFVI